MTILEIPFEVFVDFVFPYLDHYEVTRVQYQFNKLFHMNYVKLYSTIWKSQMKSHFPSHWEKIAKYVIFGKTEGTLDGNYYFNMYVKFLELWNYMNLYSGSLRLRRILKYCEIGNGSVLEEKKLASVLSINEFEKSNDFVLYEENFESLKANLPNYEKESDWIAVTKEKMKVQEKEWIKKLDDSFGKLTKEEIFDLRMKISQFYYEHNQYQSCLKMAIRGRDQVENVEQIKILCLSIIKPCFDLQNFAVITQYAQRYRQVVSKTDLLDLQKMKFLLGVTNYRQGSYNLNRTYLMKALPHFQELDETLGEKYNSVISLRDVGMFRFALSILIFEMNEFLSNFEFKFLEKYEPKIHKLYEKMKNKEKIEEVEVLTFKEKLNCDLFLFAVAGAVLEKLESWILDLEIHWLLFDVNFV